ncbi:glucuronate isomerase [Bacillus sp. ISL-40]|uniref:glucuronate isomerase n=1 Tax=unclassified Bacillus (in: firmicutes) TaxID=185979 RepID=UPI001BEA5D87|nr:MULTISPECIES: glucuronate isomerase [unclassified Bacillus (in: firmicutes)]MBT2700228.1 glucuronate isomerase [Bacillus sp. ISL-40]MBT2721808.1 glucuronate isomerase [Bacillus sp. ISL-46]MBT2740513.1 glucuronate isomerase [Bacillus sp. ISL-77]
MKKFMDQHFLLNTDTAVKLYENAAASSPIFDFHCHLDPEEVWENKSYDNITQIWLGGDHYKWRTMRMHGIGEQYITGDAGDWEKFAAWAETVPHLIGNPVYHWTHLELKMVFGIDKVLSPETAREIWEECNEKLQTPEFSARALIERSNVKFIGTTDDPISTLEFHQLLKNDETFKTIIAPTFRPDGALFIERPTFKSWIEKLADVSGIKTDSLDGFLTALKQRVEYFHENGGRASDHDIQKMEYVETTKQEVEAIFNKRISGEQLTNDEMIAYRIFLLKELGKMYAEKQWVMQLHMGAMRNNNTRMKELLGTDVGFDSVGEANMAEGLSRFLDALDQENALPRTVLFNLNQKDNVVLAGMMGNFYEEGIPGKVQLGSGWWFLDHIDGMERQMKDFANVGLLSHFIGMLTDSRSFLSYARHDYFRRILCNLLGEWVEKGLAPNDMKQMEQMVKNICFDNAEKYFLRR